MRYQLRTGLVMLAVTGLAVLAGCGSPATAAAPEAAAPAAASAPSQDAPVATNAVSIENFVFSPATVTIKAGTTITWTNRDQDAHTVTAMSGGAFHSPTLNTGLSYQYTFTTPGRFGYLCTIHPFMTATVVVTP